MNIRCITNLRICARNHPAKVSVSNAVEQRVVAAPSEVFHDSLSLSIYVY